MTHATLRDQPRTPRARRRPRLGISGRLILLHVLVLCIMTALLGAIQVSFQYRRAQANLGQQALTTSQLVASLPQVVQGTRAGRPTTELNIFVNTLRAQTAADFIVVGNRQGIRLAHPIPERVGLPMQGGDNAAPLAGQSIISVARGSLGTSVRGKVPIRDTNGEVIGVVSTGYLMPRVRALALQTGLALLPWFTLALALGTVGAVLVARHLKRAILNLEPEQIAALVHEHRAVLAALREGVVAVDAHGALVLANDRARQLLAPHATDLPVELGRVWPDLLAASEGGTRIHDLELRLSGAPVLVNVEPLTGGGFVASFRDRREVMALAEELTQVRGFVDVLRAQTHEYHNRLHTIAGLLQLERPDDALRLITGEIQADASFRELVRDIQSPRLVALLLGKRERAQELGVNLQVEPGSNLSARWDVVTDALITSVGNLVENAFESFQGRPGNVRVVIGEDPEGVQIEVLDDGPGVQPGVADRVFLRGVSSKGSERGHGLANVRARVEALGGHVRHFRRGQFTVFQVNLPGHAAPGAAQEERS